MKKLLLTLALLAWSFPAWANYTYTSAQIAVPNAMPIQFLQGTDTAGVYKTAYTAGTNGSRISKILITSNDSTAHVVNCDEVISTVHYRMFQATTSTTLPGFSNTVGAIDGFVTGLFPLPIEAQGNSSLIIPYGATIQCTFATALSGAGMLINVFVQGGGDF